MATTASHLDKPGTIPTMNRQAYVCLLEMAQTCQQMNQSIQTIANQPFLTEIERSQLNQIDQQLGDLRQELKQLGFTLIGVTSSIHNPLTSETVDP
jgi:NifB/MoaA-like Fe-S oxidoreductase